MEITYEYLTIPIARKDNYKYSDEIYTSMYQMCPSGVLDVLYSAFAKNEYKSKYWTKKDDTMIFKYDMGDVTYIYSEKKIEFRKDVRFSIMSANKTFDFTILQMEAMWDPKKENMYDMVTFEGFENSTKEKGTFFLAKYDLEDKIYQMNHLKRSEILNDD